MIAGSGGGQICVACVRVLAERIEEARAIQRRHQRLVDLEHMVDMAQISGLSVTVLGAVSPEAESLLRAEDALRLEVLPIGFRRDGRLSLAVAEPPSQKMRVDVARLTQREVDFCLVRRSELKEALRRAYGERPNIGPADLPQSGGLALVRACEICGDMLVPSELMRYAGPGQICMACVEELDVQSAKKIRT
jgi:hypothetical protein